MDIDNKVTGAKPIKPRSKRWLVIVLAACLVVALAAAGFFGWKYFENGKQINELNDKVAAMEADLAGREAKEADKGTAPELSLIEQLFKAYEAAGYNKDGTVLIDATAGGGIKNSPLAPYQTIQASLGTGDGIGGGYGYFFREGENGQWQFGYGGNGYPGCENFGMWKFRLIFADHECGYNEYSDSGDGSFTGVVTTVKKFYES